MAPLLTLIIIVSVFRRSWANDHDEWLRLRLAGLYFVSRWCLTVLGACRLQAAACCILCLRADTFTRYNVLYDMQYNVFHDGYQNRN